ncbi:MAG: hypothetical protein HYX65_07795 [Gemmatimonadetes bacterium]|nr:hypothetical protein [Gemmatimonadota bacterium]
MTLTARDYDRLEGAIDRGRRLAIWRRGTEFVVIPRALRVVDGREALDARHPATGDALRLWIDEVDRWEVVS